MDSKPRRRLPVNTCGDAPRSTMPSSVSFKSHRRQNPIHSTHGSGTGAERILPQFDVAWGEL